MNDLLDDDFDAPEPGSNAPEYTVSEISGAVKKTLEGAFGRSSEFVRTPKAGVSDSSGRRSSTGLVYRSPKTLTIFVELFFGVYFLATLVIAIMGSHYFAIPFLVLFLSGYLYVAVKSLIPALKVRESTAPADVPAETALAAPRPQM